MQGHDRPRPHAARLQCARQPFHPLEQGGVIQGDTLFDIDVYKRQDMADPDARPQAYAAWRADLALALRSGRHAGLHAALFDAPEGGWLALGASPLVADGGSLHAVAESLLGTARGLATGDDEPFDYLNYVLWRQDIEADDAAPVSYTHLDVYKRQDAGRALKKARMKS